MSSPIDIYVAHTSLLDEEPVSRACDAFFSRSDIEEFDRFAADEPRRERRLSRALVRVALGKLTGNAPGEWHFRRSANGKLLVVADSVLPFDFSISHAHGLVVCAISTHGRVGVDIEHSGRHVQARAISKRFFTPAESQLIDRAPEHMRSQLFLRYWALKEAYLKAHGVGLNESLQSVEFDLAGEQPRIVATALGDVPAAWQVEQFVPAADFVGALLAERQGSDRSLNIVTMSAAEFVST